MGYQPYGKTNIILDRAMEHIRSVEYQVSVRWVFYRLLQESLYKKKADYINFVMLASRARKAWYDGWTPATLADDTRQMDIFPTDGEIPEPDIDDLIHREIQEAKENIDYHREQAESYRHYFYYEIDPNCYQHNFCVIMFEARAMHQQFKAYTHGLTLCPFGGQPSIPYKWKIAKYIEQRCLEYGKDAVVLYFGDLDDAGLTIFNAGKEDISQWCEAKIEFVRCGLTEEQAARYQIPENFEHPGNYQWEALTDPQAREIIEGSLRQYYDLDAPVRAKQEANRISEAVIQAVNEHIATVEY